MLFFVLFFLSRMCSSLQKPKNRSQFFLSFFKNLNRVKVLGCSVNPVCLQAREYCAAIAADIIAQPGVHSLNFMEQVTDLAHRLHDPGPTGVDMPQWLQQLDAWFKYIKVKLVPSRIVILTLF